MKLRWMADVQQGMRNPHVATLLVVAVTGCQSPQMNPAPPPVKDVVLLLHGLARTSGSMRSLHGDLESEGYRVVDFDYPSIREPLEVHGRRLHDTLAQLDADPEVGRIHVVTHSLGGIVTRHALTLGVPKKMGRVVMLAPPNKGSQVAKRLTPVLGRWVKALPQLSSAKDSAVNTLASVEGVEIGIIAAEKDGKVRVEDTHLAGEADHLVVGGRHTFIMTRKDVRRQVSVFLRSGRFEHEPGAESRPTE